MSDDIRADAPGRVNLIGEHTDYQDGYVMPCAVPQRTRVRLTPRADRRVNATSNDARFAPLEYALGRETRSHGWGDYVQGVTVMAAQHGCAFGGFDLDVSSDVPVGSGLSSSAALLVATLRAMRSAFALALDDIAIAKLARRAEVEFVGAPVGIMDQMASSLGREGEALFLDTRSLEFERLPLPTTLDLVVIDSGIAHEHASGEYGVRRREAEAAAKELGVNTLRELEVSDLPRLSRLAPTLEQRARHIVTENARVVAARQALLSGDLPTLGALFSASHASLRDDYEVSVPAVDRLVSIAQSHDGVFGARMTGGGFGGAVVVAAAQGRGADLATAISREYDAQTGRSATVLLPQTH